ncbi:MAG: hypothetical protein K8F60_18540 [Melioribacteraceae bacterium]|nr:hypothetical protein [Melioribacteraceae bacterium]
MFLFKRKSGYFYICYNISGKRHYKSTGTTKKAEALRVLQSFQLAQSKPQSQVMDISLFKYFVHFIKYSEAYHTKATTRDYMITFKKFKKFLIQTLF